MGVNVSWGDRTTAADELVKLFLRTVEPSYISHGEIYCGRAMTLSRWADDLPDKIYSEINGCLEEVGSSRVVVARASGHIAGFALVDLPQEIVYCTIEDIVVDPALSNRGVGSALLSWIEREAQERGYRGILLESGIRNTRAHGFFHRHDFTRSSIMMSKEFSKK